jgi:hypothetical protein
MGKPIVFDNKILTIMQAAETKSMGLKLKLELVDGTKRKGIYSDLIYDPLNRVDYKDTLFIVFITNQPEPDTKVYLPINMITTIEWSY